MNLFSVNTTAWTEEDFILVTTLTMEDIVEVINPLVNAERDGYEPYTNHDLLNALKKRYPNSIIYFYDNPNKIVI
jgi:hypothetical protein